MKRYFLLFVCVVAAATAAAQPNRANYKLAQGFEQKVKQFNNDLTVRPYFINDTDRFWYSFKTSKGLVYYLVDPAKKKQELLFDSNELLGKICAITGKMGDPNKFNPNKFDFDKKGTSFTFNHEGDDFSYNLTTKKVEKLEKKEENKKESTPSAYTFSPDSCYIIYSKNHNLFLLGNADKGKDTTEVQLTFDGERYYSYARSPHEAEEESITNPRGRWSKNSKKFIVPTEDDRKLSFMHVVDVMAEPLPKLKSYKYSVPGDTTITQTALLLIDIESKKITTVPTAKWKDQYVEYSYDTKKGDKLFFYRTKRTWDEKELCVYNINTGEVKVLINEVDKPFFDYVIAQTHYLNDGKEIILRSERTGYGHFYLYDGESGKLKRTVTSGSYVTGQIHAIDTLKREIFFYGFGREKGVDPYYYMLYKTHLDRGGLELLTPENAQHSEINSSKSNNYHIDGYSRVDMAPVNVVRDRNGKIVMRLCEPDLKSIYASGWRAPERFSVKSADGVTDLYGVMWKPMDFDSTKKYPIISEVYPGPQFEYVPTSFRLKDSYATQLAQLGFIVIQVGHRGGTPMRGKFYHRQSYNNMRDYPLADDKAAISELAQRYPFIDISKVGIFGHSGGGFMSTAALCTYPDFYTAAVSSAGNHDNRIYNTGWIEMNNGVKEVVKKAKEGEDLGADTITFKSNTIKLNQDLAKNYKGHLMLVHGMMDDNVNPAHSFRMARALMDANKNFDMVFLPKSNHGFSGSEEDFFLGKMWRHFAKYLLNDPSGDYQYELDKFYEKTK